MIITIDTEKGFFFFLEIQHPFMRETCKLGIEGTFLHLYRNDLQ